jgi:chromosome segregation ATPase
MLKKLRRYSSRSIPVKKQARILIKSVHFEKSAVSPGGQFKIVFTRDKRNSSTSTKKVTSADSTVVAFDETLALSVTFYQDAKSKVQEKKGSLALHMVGSGNVPVVMGSVDLALHQYFGDSNTSLQELELVLTNNGKPCGVFLRAEISFTDDGDDGQDDKDSDVSDNVSVHSESAETRQPTVAFTTPGMGKSRSVEGFATLDFMSPIAEDSINHGDPLITPDRTSLSAKFDYEDLGFKNPNEHEEVAALTVQLSSMKADNAKKQEELVEVKEKLQHLMALMELQSAGKGFTSEDDAAEGDWIPDITSPVKMEAFMSPGVPWSANPMSLQQRVNEHRKRSTMQEMKVLELSTETEVQQELIKRLKQSNAEQSAELTNLRAECNQKTDSVMTLESRMTEAVSERDQALKDKQAAAEKLQRSENQLNELKVVTEKNATSSAKEKSEFLDQINSANAVIRQLRETISSNQASINSQASDLTQLRAENSNLTSQIGALKLEIESLNSQVAEAKEAAHARFKSTLKAEVESMSTQLEQSKTESNERLDLVASLKNEIESLSSRLVAADLAVSNLPKLESELTMIRAQLSASQEECSHYIDSQRTMSNDIHSLNFQVSQLSSDQASALETNDKLSGRVESLTERLTECALTNDALATSLRAKLDNLEVQLTESNSLNDARAKTINELEVSLTKSKQQAAESVESLSKLQVEFDSLSMNHSTSVEKFSRETEAIKVSLADALVRAESVATVESLLSLTQQQLSRFQAENSALVGRMQALQTHYDLLSEEHEANCAVLNSMKMEVLELVQARASDAEDLHSVRSEIAVLKDSAIKSLNECDQLNNQLSHRFHELIAFVRTNTDPIDAVLESFVMRSAELELHPASANSVQSSSGISELEGDVDNLKSELLNLRRTAEVSKELFALLLEKFRMMNDNLAVQGHELEVTKSERSRLQAELTAQSAVLSTATVDAKDRDTEIFALATQNRELEAKVSLLTEINESKDAEIKLLTEKVAKSSTELEILSSEKRVDERQLAKLAQDISRFSAVGEDGNLISAVVHESEITAVDAASNTPDAVSPSIQRSSSMPVMQAQVDAQTDELHRLRLELAEVRVQHDVLKGQAEAVGRLFGPGVLDDDGARDLKVQVVTLSETNKCSLPQAAMSLLQKKSQNLSELESQNIILRNALDSVNSPNRKKSDNYSSLGGPEEIQRSKPEALLAATDTSGRQSGSIASGAAATSGPREIVWAKNEAFPCCKSCNRPFNRLSRWRYEFSVLRVCRCQYIAYRLDCCAGTIADFAVWYFAILVLRIRSDSLTATLPPCLLGHVPAVLWWLQTLDRL